VCVCVCECICMMPGYMCNCACVIACVSDMYICMVPGFFQRMGISVVLSYLNVNKHFIKTA